MKKFIVGILSTIFVLSFLTTGCSNNDGKVAEKEKAKTTIMQEIKQRKKLIVATEATFPPFEFIENGKFTGYGPEILQEIVKNMDVELDQQDVPFSGIFAGLESKKFDFIASVLTVTPERTEKYAFTTPLADNSWVVVTQIDNTSINSIADINEKTIGVNLGGSQETQLIKDNEKLKAEGKQGFELKTYPSTIDAFMDLKNGRIDAVVTARPVTNYTMKREPDTYAIKASVKDQVYLAWGVRKEDKDLLEFLNTEILKLKKSGKLAELQQKWFGTTWDLPDTLPTN